MKCISAMKATLLVLFLSLACSSTAHAEVYKTIAPDGKPVFSDKPPPGTKPASPPAPEAQRSTKSEPPGSPLERAIIGVLGLEDLVRQTERLCLEANPEGSRNYSSAASSWRDRNAPFVARALRALRAKFGDSDRALITLGIAARNAKQLQAVRQGSTAVRVKWCDQSAGQMASRQMDVAGMPALAAPLARE